MEVPGISQQAAAAGFSASLYDFRKAKVEGLDYFNPALVRRQDGLWLVTRRSEVRENLTYGFNSLMAFSLNEDHLPQVGYPIAMERVATGEHFEDPRAFQHGGSWWLSVCNFVIFPGSRSWTGAHQMLVELDSYGWQTYRRYDPVYGRNSSSLFEQKGDEKNWLWFSHEGRLHLIYLTTPHIVVRWDEQLRAIEEFRTEMWHPAWEHGQPRGGSAPVQVGDEYVSFFHSSTPWRDGRRRYHMGAYAFEAKPPFMVTRVTPKPLLSGSIDDPWQEGKPLVVFPCAALHENDSWTVSLGVNDLVSARAVITDKVLRKRLSKEVALPKAKSRELSDFERVYG